MIRSFEIKINGHGHFIGAIDEGTEKAFSLLKQRPTEGGGGEEKEKEEEAEEEQDFLPLSFFCSSPIRLRASPSRRHRMAEKRRTHSIVLRLNLRKHIDRCRIKANLILGGNLISSDWRSGFTGATCRIFHFSERALCLLSLPHGLYNCLSVDLCARYVGKCVYSCRDV